MDTEGGGWTLVGNSAGQANSGKTFAEYELGFGNANQQNGFIGLSWLHILTNSSIPMRYIQKQCAQSIIRLDKPEFFGENSIFDHFRFNAPTLH